MTEWIKAYKGKQRIWELEWMNIVINKWLI